MTLILRNASPDYLTPVYNPIESEFYFLTSASTASTYSMEINFNIPAISANTSPSDFTLNNVLFSITFNPQQNEIPKPQYDFANFIYFVEEVIKNNPLFDNYQVDVIDSDSIRLTNKTPFTTDRLIFATSSVLSEFSFSEIIPQYEYDAQSRSNYSIWVEIYKTDTTIFRSIFTANTTPELVSTQYKVFQPSNSYIFNYSNILQSQSRTDNWGTANSQANTFFQKDNNSLGNFKLRLQESYDVNFTTAITSNRKFNLDVGGGTSFIDDIWFWDASRKLPFASEDAEKYYNINYDGLTLSSVTTIGEFTILFKYNPVVDEFLYISNGYTGFNFTVSTTNDFANGLFKLENVLSSTTNNFKSSLKLYLQVIL
jgi:hypothetical protein